MAYALDVKDGVSSLVPRALIGMVGGLLGVRLRPVPRVPAANNRHRCSLGAVAVAFLFPFTQGGSDANMSIATQVLIFATTALGLNIVVGLAGLLDLGYIAFLGAGAYVGATMSYSAFATIGWKPPFLVVMVIGGMASATPRPHHRFADPARLGRLPRHRHPGVRRDLPARDEQPRR